MHRAVIVPMLLCLVFSYGLSRAGDDESMMVSINAGYVSKEVAQQYNDYMPWRRGFSINADMVLWDRDEVNAPGLTVAFQRFFRGSLPKNIIQGSGSNWILSVGPSYFLRTLEDWFPANIRLLFIPHIGAGTWRYTVASGSKSTLTIVASLALGAQFQTGRNMEWNIKMKPVSIFAQGIGIRAFELTGGFNFYP